MTEELQDQPPVILLRRRTVVILGAIVGLALAGTIAAVVYIAVEFNNEQNRQIKRNSDQIKATDRAVERIDKLENPTKAEIRNQIRRALRLLAADPRIDPDARQALRSFVEAGERRARRERGRSSGATRVPREPSEQGSNGDGPRVGTERPSRGTGVAPEPPASDPPPASAPPRPDPPPSNPPPPVPPRPTLPRPNVETPPSVPVPRPQVCTPIIGVNCP